MFRTLILLLNLAAWLPISSVTLAAESTRPQRPNFVVIMADDLGAKELGCYGQKVNLTPNLDRLAAGGVRFRTCWATPICSPTRVEIMTGRYGFRTGWYNLIGRETALHERLDADEITFADMLKTAGYATGLTGKWQLGTITKHPTMIHDSGFDDYRVWAWTALPAEANYKTPPGKRSRLSRFWYPAIIENGKQLRTKKKQYGPDLYADWLIDFMKRNKDRPFVAYYPMCLTHKPWEAPPDPDRPGRNKPEGLRSNIEYMDTVVGRIVKALEVLGLRERTIVLFTGDNGTAEDGKGKTTELGARVPMIVSCPGVVKAGVVSDELIDLSDVLPTLAELAGAKLPEGVTIDGKSFAPILRGQKGPTREWIFSYLTYNRLLRDKRWLLEGDGRFFDCGTSRDGTGYKDVTGSDDPEVIAARKRFDEILKKLPAPSKLKPPPS